MGQRSALLAPEAQRESKGNMTMSQSTTEVHAATDDFDPSRDPDRRQDPRQVGEVRSIDEVRQKAAPGPVEAEAETAPPTPDPVVALTDRLGKLERSNRLLRLGIVVIALFTGYVSMDKLFPDGVIVQKTMMESKELKLVDGDGNARLFLRMYSRVPVLQIVDTNGKPRLSLGLRFDDTPFIDLSDRRGNTRATLEMTEEDAAALRLYDDKGQVSFKIN